MDSDMTEKQTAITKFLQEELFKWAARVMIWAMAAALAWIFTPAGDYLVKFLKSPIIVSEMQETLTAYGQKIDFLTKEVAIARAPQEIVEYGPASNFGQSCDPGDSCLLSLEIRRSSDQALQCKIIPGATKREIISVSGGRIWEPDIESANARNIGINFVVIEVNVKMPLGLTDGKYYYRQTTYYTDCPWQVNGNPPVTSSSPLIEFEIQKS
jgi:hypothetical protein